MSYDPTSADDDDCAPERLFEILSTLAVDASSGTYDVPIGPFHWPRWPAHVSAWEAETEVDRVSHDDVATRLHRVHLPKLSDTEMISCQREHQAVALEKGAGEAEAFLDYRREAVIRRH